MSRTYRGYNLVRDKSRKKTKDRKRFVYRGENWSVTSQGGPGNKRAWNLKLFPKWLYHVYKNKQIEE